MKPEMASAIVGNAKNEGRRMENVTLNLNAIPEYQQNMLADFAIELTKAVFSRPGEEEKYQQWLANRRAKIANKQEGVTE